MTERKLFGTDGVRGPANVHPMTPELSLRLGRAIARVAGRGKTRAPRVVIGKDTRLSGYMLEQAIASGICAMGGRVMLSGPIPTPAVANLTHSMRADAGIVISASHNPFADNGIKIFGPDGFKLPDSEELEIERLLESQELDTAGATGAKIGRAERIDDATGRYIVYAKRTFPEDLTLDGLRIVVDAAHGAAYKVAPLVFRELGAEVISLGCKPNGQNINKGCGALHPEHVAREVVRKKADLGVALDGDADRLILIDEKGQEIDGDAVMALCAIRMLREKRLKKKTLVATVMSNMGLEIAIQGAGGKLLRTSVGDRYVVEAMRRHGYSFGGEQSGHLVFMDHATTGDGVVGALQVLGVMVREMRPVSELARVLERMPQVLESIRLPARKPLEQMPKLLAIQSRAEKKLGKNGRILVRWSGTEPKLRLMAEGPEPKLLNQLLSEMAEAARLDLGS
ncbi:MAG: phosphoglucosamine mutase [Polyangiaceae bacterium]|nr:phosphoglucosamine mutase [Polyangiaceae bacterium]MCB9606277.1 phosphoglucosamine mutase [Polyangiaceae bacterium]